MPAALDPSGGARLLTILISTRRRLARERRGPSSNFLRVLFSLPYSVPSNFPSGETSTSMILPDLVLPFSSMLSCPLNLSL